MDREETERFIQARARENRNDPAAQTILWSRHALAELMDEGWELGAVELALRAGEVIEVYPVRHRPLPDCLVFGWLAADVAFHAVVAVDEVKERLLMVTVYRPHPEEWHDDWRTRKR